MIMKHSLLIVLLLVSAKMISAQAKIPTPEIQIKMALMAAPEEKREGAKVYGYDSKGAFTLLREGTNEMICLADDPAQKGFSVACYHKDLEPFMARGRELKAQGKESKDIMDIRDAETKAGKLKMNTAPSTLYVYTAKEEDCDLTTGAVNNGYLRVCDLYTQCNIGFYRPPTETRRSGYAMDHVPRYTQGAYHDQSAGSREAVALLLMF